MKISGGPGHGDESARTGSKIDPHLDTPVQLTERMPDASIAHPHGRRIQDQELILVLARAGELGTPTVTNTSITGFGDLELRGIQIDLQGGVVRESQAPRHHPESDSAFLLDLGGEEAILVAGAAVHRIPRGKGGEELLGRAASGAAVWRSERLRTWKRAQLPELLIAFSEQLNRAETENDVYRALVEATPRIVGGYTAVLMLREEGDTLAAVELPTIPYEVRHLSLPSLPRFRGSGLITREEARADTGSPFSGLSPLVRDINAALLAHVPFDDGVLILVDRRQDRVFGPEDWDLMGTLTRQAYAALRRVRLFHEVHSLSLSDPLTGLANRRQMKVVLERGLAAARRGEGLAVVMFDLDGFKQINDEQGHLAGDRILVTVADALQREARGADLVVRYGGDEFLVLLPGGSAQGASALVRRVRQRLAGEIEVSAGVAEYTPQILTVEQMIEAADRNLYIAKNHRKQWKE
jgi:diguanylate cyclase (GGDEF)-like protein